MYILTATKWHRDWKSHPGQIVMSFEGETLKECMNQYYSETLNNDLTVFEPMAIAGVINTEEEQ